MSWWRSGGGNTPANADPPRERLLEVAKAEAAARGWPWLEPIEIALASVSSAGRVWTVRTNCAARGLNIRVTIRERDFSIQSAGFLPR